MQYFHAPSCITILDAVQRGDRQEVAKIASDRPESVLDQDDKGYSSFHWAAYIDNTTILDILYSINPEALISAKTKKNQTVLHIACSNGCVQTVSSVISLLSTSLSSSNLSEYINTSNNHKETALHIAAGTNRIDIVDILLSAGADVYAVDQWKRTPRKVALENGYLQSAATIEREYTSSYDTTQDLPEVTAPVLANTPQQVSVAEELKQKLLLSNLKKINGTNINIQHEQQHFFGLTKTVTEEKTIFATPASTVAHTTECSQDSDAVKPIALPKMSLSKLVEFPGDEAHVRDLVENRTATVALNGKDMYGLTALMKFAAWNKINLLNILLPLLTTEEVNTLGGKKKLPLLHYCVDMDASAALERLLQDERIDTQARDEYGRTWKEHAIFSGKSGLFQDSTA